MKLSVKSLLFDYGGTIDTNGVHWGEVIWQAYLDSGVPVSYEQFREAYVLVEQTLGSQPIIQSTDTFREVLNLKIKLQFDRLGLIDFASQRTIADACYAQALLHTRRASLVLERLKARYPLFLVSNFYGNLRTALCEFNLIDYFQAVIESAEVGYRKPGLELFQLALDKTGYHPSEVAIIGDSYKNDIQPAIRLGCPSIWLRGKGWDNQDEAVVHPCIISDIQELLNIL